MATETKGLYLGGGKLFILNDDSSLSEFAQIKDLSLESTIETLEHENTDGASVSIDYTATIKKEATLKITTESITAENLSLAFMGNIEEETQATKTAETSTVTAKKNTTLRLPYKKITNITLTKADTSTLTETVDFSIDREAGILTFTDTVTDGESLEMSVDCEEVTIKTINSLSETSKEVSLLFVGKSKVGKVKEFEFFRVVLKPSGGFNLKAREWNTLEFEGQILEDSSRNETSGGGRFFAIREQS
jgi:hypothetical protein